MTEPAKDGKHYPLTQKQERFAQVYVETGNASEAYRQAYNVTTQSDGTINRNAWNLLHRSKIERRVNEIRAEHAKRHEINVDSLTERYYEVMALAQAKGDTSTMKAALDSLAKLHGVWVDRSETKDVTDQHVKAIEDLARAKRDRLQVVEDKAKAG
jgi:phage terminase small subunit